MSESKNSSCREKRIKQREEATEERDYVAHDRMEKQLIPTVSVNIYPYNKSPVPTK